MKCCNDETVVMLNDTTSEVNIDLLCDIVTKENSMINVNDMVNDSLSECEIEDSVDNNGYADQMFSVLDELVCDSLNENCDVSNECNSVAVNDHNQDLSQNIYMHEENSRSEVISLRHRYPENMIIGHLNVNSLGMKYQEIAELLNESRMDALMISETKLDNSTKDSLFELNEYVIYRQDKRSNSGGILAYISKNITSTEGPINVCEENVECMSIELNVKDNKILLVCMYKNPKMTPNDFKQRFEDICEKILDNYEHVIIIGDLNFNMFQENNALKSLCPTYNLTNIINDATCFKSNVPTLIDVMLVSKRKKFIKGFSYDVGISDFHNLIGGVLKLNKPVPKQKTVFHRKLNDIDYNVVNNELMNLNLEQMISQESNVNVAFKKMQDSLIQPWT